MGNLGYTVVIVLLSILASFSITALWVLMGRLSMIEDHIAELEDRLSVIYRELLAHTHNENKAEPTIPASHYPIVRYTWERKKRMRWQ